MIAYILMAVGWLICGILAQGMCRYNISELVGSSKKYYGPSLILLLTLTLCGPLGLLGGVIVCAIDKTWGLKFRYKE